MLWLYQLSKAFDCAAAPIQCTSHLIKLSKYRTANTENWTAKLPTAQRTVHNDQCTTDPQDLIFLVVCSELPNIGYTFSNPCPDFCNTALHSFCTTVHHSLI